jgi:hypothetical protein
VIPVRFQDGPFDLDAEILRLVWLISFVTLMERGQTRVHSKWFSQGQMPSE